MSGRSIQFLAFLQESFQGAKSIVMQASVVFGPKFEVGGQKSLHLSRGLLRDITDVKWHSIGSTMTSIVKNLLKHIANLSAAVTSEHIHVVVTHQSQKTQGFCVADFATLSDERRSRSKLFPLFIWIKNLAFENLKDSNVRNFLGFRKLS